MKNPPSYNIGIVGATGAVGQELLKLLFARSFPCASLRLFASARSTGKTIEMAGKKFTVAEARPEIFEELDIAFPPSGNWLTFDGLPLNSQPSDLLMQLIEYFFVRDGLMKVNPDADIRPARVLKEELLARIGEIKTSDGSVGQEG